MSTRHRLPCLETREFLAYIADNNEYGVHMRGYNGVSVLIPKRTGNNIFEPRFAGLNYEAIDLAGLPKYVGPNGSGFEPRCELMEMERADKTQVVLVQPETSFAHVSARIEFRIEEPYYIHQHIELMFHRKFCAKEEKNVFRSLWASYIHIPPDRHLYMKTDLESADLKDWIGVTKEDHGSKEWIVKQLPDDRRLSASQHLEIMNAGKPVSTNCNLSDIPLNFYYGICHGTQMLLKIFRQPERFRFVYSPCGAGKMPAWCPAFDYYLVLDDAQLGRTYVWDLCLIAKEYAGREDVMEEVRKYRRNNS